VRAQIIRKSRVRDFSVFCDQKDANDAACSEVVCGTVSATPFRNSNTPSGFSTPVRVRTGAIQSGDGFPLGCFMGLVS
jgi:hypothetical protein